MSDCFDSNDTIDMKKLKKRYFNDIVPKCIEDIIMTYATSPLTLESKWQYDAWSNGILHTSATTDGNIYVFSRWGSTDVNVFNTLGQRQKDFTALCGPSNLNLNQAIRCNNVMWTHMISNSPLTSIHIWDAETGEAIRTIDLPSKPSVDVAFAYACECILIMCNDGKFYLFREDGTFLRSFVANSSNYFRFFAFNDTAIFVSCCRTKCVQVYDLYGNFIRSIGNFNYIGAVSVHNNKVYVIGLWSELMYDKILSVFNVYGNLLAHFSFETDTDNPALVTLSSNHILIRDTRTIRIYRPVYDDQMGCVSTILIK